MIESPINYMGAKYKLLDKLIPLFPKDKKVFYDLFTGGGSVYMNISHLYKSVYANDILADLRDIHERLRTDADLLIKYASAFSIPTKDSQERYLRLREEYNSCGGGDRLLALIWSCNSNMMRFNNDFKFNQTWGKRCFNKNTQKKVNIYKTKDYSNVFFQSLPFYEVVIARDSFVYLDPPYSNTKAGYNAFWKDDDEKKLISMIAGFIDSDVSFGISGVLNGKENKVYDFLKTKDLNVHFFGDLYQKISKSEKVNQEYYITNVENAKDTLF